MDGGWILVHLRRGRKRTLKQNPSGGSNDAHFGMDHALPNFNGRGGRTLQPNPNPNPNPNPRCKIFY